MSRRTARVPVRSRDHLHRLRRLRMEIEPLEERLMLSATPGVPSPDIVVGRSLSAYTVGATQNNQVTITYTVYNEKADPETGVLLTTTLAPGVAFASASRRPTRAARTSPGAWGRSSGSTVPASP